jgi:hypothetical protein
MAVSEMADDIQDALLEYKVCSEKSRVAVVTKNWDDLTDDPATGDI